MTLARAALCLLAAASLLLSACSAAERRQDGPLVLAAASLQEAMEAAADEWERQGHERPVLSFAATSALARQVEAGAPGDLFISADEAWMDTLEQDGHLAPGTRRNLVGNRLVLIAGGTAPADGLVAPGEALARLRDGDRLAMADPDSVPAGRYGKQALTALGLWDEVAGRLAVGENVRVALTLVNRGEAPLGIVYRTDAMAETNVHVAAEFPTGSHTPITYPIARLAASTHPGAQDFADFLLSDDGQAILAGFGFEPG